jgi:hypothetical protein
MANFSTHVNVAFAASGVAGLVLFQAGMLSAPMFVTAVLMGTIGGLLPDLDSDNSTPLSVGFTVFALFIAFGAVIWLSARFMLLELLAIWAISFVTIRYGVLKLFNELTVHRGCMHSIPYAVLFGLMALYWCFYGLDMSALQSWMVGLFVSFGALIHLILDEVYSVNLTNMQMKRSFGTAMKLFDRRQWPLYVGLYTVVGLGFYAAPDHALFVQTLTDVEAWQGLSHRLIR